MRREAVLRLVDAFDLESPAVIAFRFFTPQRPQRLMNGLRLGPVDMTWEGGLSCDVRPLNARFPDGDASGDALYAITLTAPEPMARGFYTFVFAPGQ